MITSQEKNQAAKFTFFYLLSLVALIFITLSTGMVVFQIINKFIPDLASFYSGNYSARALRFALSALIVAVPVFYLISYQIHKNLYLGKLSPDSAIRKWLTYLILLVASVVMFVWIIVTINNFLNGELTLKFALKFLTVLIIAGSVFGFYLYDIKRENILNNKDKVIKLFGISTLFLVIIVFAIGLLVVESPWEARAKRLDREILNDFSNLEGQIYNYYQEQGELPQDLEEVFETSTYLTKNIILNPKTGIKYDYQVKEQTKYELCTDFNTSSEEEEILKYYHPRNNWSYQEGYNCIDFEVKAKTDRLDKLEVNNPEPVPVSE